MRDQARVTTQCDLHSGGSYTNSLARKESACMVKLGVNWKTKRDLPVS